MVRVKFGKFFSAVSVYPGDIFNLKLSSEYIKEGQVETYTQTVSTPITVTQVVTDWVMFFIPGVGFGGMFGNSELRERILQMFPTAYEVPDGESVFQG
ncbi:MAG: hypothetical protein E6Q97_00525 [Desulfurellales bacterium]|nr:MAG: hypothetical protein E6Q97_00525 [Desulfurellales bacterium]